MVDCVHLALGLINTERHTWDTNSRFLIRWEFAGVLRIKKSASIDQLAIIDLLARIPPERGGKKDEWGITPPLPGFNGYCPKELATAIEDFQKHWKAKNFLSSADGVVDPNRSSIALLNALAFPEVLPTPPAPIPGSDLVLMRTRALIPKALQRQKSAYAMALWARIATEFPDTNDFNKAALRLANRCFKVTSDSRASEAVRSDIDMFASVYSQGIAFLSLSDASLYFHDASDAACRAATGTDARAYTTAGAFADRSYSVGIILNRDACAGKSDAFLLDIITHEVAHFCGPKPSSDVKDHAYQAAALRLPREQALKCAANHAWFAGLSQTEKSNWPTGSYPS